MRRRGLYLLFCLALGLGSCSHLPNLKPLAPDMNSESLGASCLALFPKQPQRLVHQIMAELPMNQHSAMLGVSLVFPARRHLRAVLLSVEGLTLLDAERSPSGDRVHRAIGPMEDKDFAKGLLDDVELLLLAPRGETRFGQVAGQATCRTQVDGGVTDIRFDGQNWHLKRYDAQGRLLRSIQATHQNAQIKALGLGGYLLKLKLQSQENLDPGYNPS
ncbi:MAG: hypothetical protein JRF33_04045 [Deltaproteobacteria bacterium]|nr:hypothetical protein [Deltaproteobacteria bacterium]